MKRRQENPAGFTAMVPLLMQPSIAFWPTDAEACPATPPINWVAAILTEAGFIETEPLLMQEVMLPVLTAATAPILRSEAEAKVSLTEVTLPLFTHPDIVPSFRRVINAASPVGWTSRQHVLSMTRSLTTAVEVSFPNRGVVVFQLRILLELPVNVPAKDFAGAIS